MRFQTEDRERVLAVESGKLLVVADDLASSSALSTSLANRGYAVDVAAAANEAIEKIRKDHYDLVLLDPALPDDSGADLLALLRGTSSRAELPVILVTDAEEGRAAEQVQNRGANDFITKPVAFPVAAARIETHLSLAHAERQARYRDALTGLDNRACLMERLEAALA